MSSLTSCDKDFLKGTTINGWLDLSSLTFDKREILTKNVQNLQEGYNKEKGYCYFDGILSKVLSVKQSGEYTIYKSPFEFIAQKGEYTAHGSTIKKAIEDLEFKVISEKIKNEPINENDEITVKRYRLITGACDIGCRNWMQNNNIEYKVEDGETIELHPIKAKDIVPILKKTNAYGFEKIQKLLNF